MGSDLMGRNLFVNLITLSSLIARFALGAQMNLSRFRGAILAPFSRRDPAVAMSHAMRATRHTDTRNRVRNRVVFDGLE